MKNLLIGISLAVIAPTLAWADAAYPDKPVKIVVPYPPGGASDVLTRKISERLTQRLGQQFIIDNRAGGNTVTASEIVIKAPADGYTLYSTNTTLIQLPALGVARYEEARDFVPIAQYASAPLALAVLVENPAKNLKELATWLKARPGKTSYATSGAGGSQHIFSEAMKRATGVDSIHIPYKGEAPLLNDFLGGRIDWYIATPITILPHVKSGKVRLLTVTGDQRLPLAPDVPTFKEEGVSDLVVVGWYGMFAPAKTPQAIVDRLSQEIAAIVRSPEITTYMKESALVPTGLTASEFSTKLPYFRESFSRMIKENNIRIE